MLFEMARALRSLTRSPIESACTQRGTWRVLFTFRRVALSQHRAGSWRSQSNKISCCLRISILSSLLWLLRQSYAAAGERSPASATILRERRAGGRIVVVGHHLLRLGDGRFDRGRQFMHTLIASIRRRHARGLLVLADLKRTLRDPQATDVAYHQHQPQSRRGRRWLCNLLNELRFLKRAIPRSPAIPNYVELLARLNPGRDCATEMRLHFNPWCSGTDF